MAQRLPSELLHEIILINDDHVSVKLNPGDRTGMLGSRWIVKHRSNPASQTGGIYSCERKLKPCAGMVRRVCRRWQFYVEGSSRLWLSRTFISINPQDMKRFIEDDLIGGMLPICHSSDIDLALLIVKGRSADPSDDANALLKFFDLVAPHLRSITMVTRWASFLTFWAQYQETLPTLPRLLSFSISADVDLSSVEIRLRSRNLKSLNVTVDAAGLGPHFRNFDFLSAVNAVSMVISPKKPKDLDLWLCRLLSGVPHLQLLDLACNSDELEEDGFDLNHPIQPIRYNQVSPLVVRLLGITTFNYMVLRRLPIPLIAELQVKTYDYEPAVFQVAAPHLEKSQSLRKLHVLGSLTELQWLLRSVDVSSLLELTMELKSPIGFEIGSESLAAAAIHLPILTDLIINTRINSSGLVPLLTYLNAPSLESLDLVSVSDRFDAGWGRSGDQGPAFPSLKHLGLHLPRLEDVDSIASFLRTWIFPTPEIMSMTGNLLRTGFRDWDGRERFFSSLRELHISQPDSISVDGFRSFAQLLNRLVNLRICMDSLESNTASAYISMLGLSEPGQVLLPQLIHLALEIQTTGMQGAQTYIDHLFEGTLKMAQERKDAIGPLNKLTLAFDPPSSEAQVKEIGQTVLHVIERSPPLMNPFV